MTLRLTRNCANFWATLYMAFHYGQAALPAYIALYDGVLYVRFFHQYGILPTITDTGSIIKWIFEIVLT